MFVPGGMTIGGEKISGVGRRRDYINGWGEKGGVYRRGGKKLTVCSKRAESDPQHLSREMKS